MKIDSLFTEDTDIEEWKATKELCKSNRSDASLGASALASCKSQGLARRDGKKSHKKPGGKRVTMGGKSIKGRAHGGWIPDYGSGSKSASKKKKK